jgi:hypothetical protein
MSSILLTCWFRKLRKEPIKLKEEIALERQRQKESEKVEDYIYSEHKVKAEQAAGGDAAR